MRHSRSCVRGGMEASAAEDTRELKAVLVRSGTSVFSVLFVVFMRVVTSLRQSLIRTIEKARVARAFSIKKCLCHGIAGLSLCQHISFLAEDKLGVPKLSHLRKIQAQELGLC